MRSTLNKTWFSGVGALFLPPIKVWNILLWSLMSLYSLQPSTQQYSMLHTNIPNKTPVVSRKIIDTVTPNSRAPSWEKYSWKTTIKEYFVDYTVRFSTYWIHFSLNYFVKVLIKCIFIYKTPKMFFNICIFLLKCISLACKYVMMINEP